MKNALISIIVPVYNSDKYISECIQSLIYQTYSKIEIIIIDDGSSDKSIYIASKLKSKDGRIKIYKKENGGASSARNLGIEKSNGKYIIFVDSDDVVDHRLVEVLYSNAVTRNSPISICGITRLNTNKIGKFASDRSKVGIIDSNCALAEMLYQRKISNGPVAKLFEKKMLANLRFNESILYAEDLLFNCELVSGSNFIVVDSAPYYYYRFNQASLSNMHFNIRRMDGLSALKIIRQLVHPDERLLSKAVDNREFTEALFIIIQIPKSTFASEYRSCWEVIKKTRKTVLYDNNSRVDYKLYALISYFGAELLILIYKCKDFIVAKARGEI